MQPVVGATDVATVPTAVVRARTGWPEFLGLWGVLLDEAYACIRRPRSAKQGCNVMLYLDDVPNVEVGVELIAPLAMTGRVVESALPAGSPGPSSRLPPSAAVEPVDVQDREHRLIE